GSRHRDHGDSSRILRERCSKRWVKVNGKMVLDARKSRLWLASVRGCRDAGPKVLSCCTTFGRVGSRSGRQGPWWPGHGSPEATPEPFQDLGSLPRSLVGPPVATAVEQDELAAHARREALREARRDEGIVAAPQDQGRSCDARHVVLPLLSDVHGR